jgi:hypothetical protein
MNRLGGNLPADFAAVNDFLNSKSASCPFFSSYCQITDCAATQLAPKRHSRNRLRNFEPPAAAEISLPVRVYIQNA